jgi:hypothetical protein
LLEYSSHARTSMRGFGASPTRAQVLDKASPASSTTSASRNANAVTASLFTPFLSLYLLPLLSPLLSPPLDSHVSHFVLVLVLRLIIFHPTSPCPSCATTIHVHRHRQNLTRQTWTSTVGNPSPHVYKAASYCSRGGHCILNHKCVPSLLFLSRSVLFLVVSWHSLPRLWTDQSPCGVQADNPGPNCPKRSALGLPSTTHQAGHGKDGVYEHRRVERDISRAELAGRGR